MRLWVYAGNGQVQLITFDGDLLWTQKLAGGGILSLDLHVDERWDSYKLLRNGVPHRSTVAIAYFELPSLNTTLCMPGRGGYTCWSGRWMAPSLSWTPRKA